jgi:hypothetical protein
MSVAEIPPHAAQPPADIQLAARATPDRALDRPAGFALTYEHAAYIGLFALALLLRLWGLGDRSLHHDETLHAAYSWRLYTGQGFLHDPLLHGPFLYHIVALGYFLFGDNDFTARLTVALFGTALVALPYLIRRELGRGAALLAAAYLTISPVFLYISRFIRHDMYSVVFELLVVISVVRYASTRQARWLLVGGAALGLMATNMETFYLFSVIVGSFVGLAFFWRVWKPGLLVGGALALMLVGLVFVLPGKPQGSLGGDVTRANGAYVCPAAGDVSPPDNPILYEPGPLLGLPPLATADNDYALCVRNQYDDNLAIYFVKLGQFFGHPAILAALMMALLGLAALYALIWRLRDRNGMTAWDRARADGGGLFVAFASLGRDRRVAAALLAFLTPYTLLFTSFLGHPSGFVSGTTGSLLYWLAQHNVKRGEQPGYYYLLQLAIYEPLALIWGIAGLVLVGLLLGRWIAQRARPGDQETRRVARLDASAGSLPASLPVSLSQPGAPIDWGFAMPLLLAWWAITTLALYSWAGEKMPWLTTHVALPIVLLGAWALARTLRWWAGGEVRVASQELLDPALIPEHQLPTPATPGNGHSPKATHHQRPRLWESGLMLFLGAFGVVMSVFFVVATNVSKPDSPAVNVVAPYLLAILLVLLVLMALFAGLLRGARWALGALALAVVLAGAAYTFRSAYRLSYQNGDNASELMVYVQTSPDVMRVVRALEDANTKRGGNMKIWYDNETVWQWYFRNFKDAQQQPPSLPAPADDVMAIALLGENYNSNPQILGGFRVQTYPLRWWSDDWHRLPPDWRSAPVTPDSPLLMRLLRMPLDGHTAAQAWQYLLYRQSPAPLGSYNFVLAVRPELANEIGLGTGEEQK